MEQKAMMPTLEYNPSGYCRAENEHALYDIIYPFLAKKYSQIKRNYPFDAGCIVDFYAVNAQGKHVLLEVKNWFLTIKDMQQLIKYLVHATEKYGEHNFELITIAGGVEEARRRILEKLGIKIWLTKDFT